ncbi:MAG: class II D-tagatose-bisphosphate aldolase, non-catalytic subunit, partial [Verrucomicrobiota bacterium]
MNKNVREKAAAAHLPLLDYILKRIKELEAQTGVKRTLFAACPNSVEVIRASLRAAKRNQAPIKFAATLNQVDTDRGYTGMTHQEFVVTIREEARRIHLQSPVIIAIDHGGPWLKDTAKLANLPYAEAMAAVKLSFEAAIAAGFDLLHVDPTIDITLGAGESIRIETVVERTLELIEHAEKFRRAGGFPQISYEVGTEEVHGGLADLAAFTSFLEGLKAGLLARGLADTWPCFVVGKVGTDLHTTTFDPVVARQLADIAARYGSLIKGHYSDGVSNPDDYPQPGLGAAKLILSGAESQWHGHG